ncbi:DUF5412 family protein [Fusibacter sp. 3D3]|uniref:DUF5412 family protein n=1 Tax=Fusibacter sp. 3D3 TaxID=1048380 RepID=UPI0008566CFA|nr:DUF5412 family protein [Fusibacter sp. 3D3]GAU76756.1 hypothetical protein F3D3_1353 [Fusibacter sp. 3D3]GAU76760.1 hypothetical protein F3D3_1357 [Fusibacter sp. 3D3]
MKKINRKYKWGFILIFIVFVILLGANYFFWDINTVPKGEYIGMTVSPNGAYEIKAYVSNSHSTVAPGVRCELIFNNRTRNIYWNYREDTAEFVWIDDDTVEINGHRLVLPDEIYDFRNK